MDRAPWTVLDRWTAYLDNPDEEHPTDLDADAVRDLARKLDLTYASRGHGRALAVTGDEPCLSATVAAAVRAFWQTPRRPGRPQPHPVWWTVPAGLKLDRLVRALAEHLGSPVARGQNPSSWLLHLLNRQRIPVLILNDVGVLPTARSPHNSLPRLVSYLVKHTSTVFVFVDPDIRRALFDAPAGIEMATRTALLTVPTPDGQGPTYESVTATV